MGLKMAGLEAGFDWMLFLVVRSNLSTIQECSSERPDIKNTWGACYKKYRPAPGLPKQNP